jgi:hypothetical protein
MSKKLELQGKALKELIQKVSAGLGEDGSAANLTQLEIFRDILSAEYLEGTLFDESWKVTVSEKAHGILLPIADQDKRNITQGILGGIVTYELTEGTDITLTFPKFAQTELALNQIGVAARVTNALVQDSTVLPQYLRKGFEDAIRMKIDRSILYGNGATNCYGVMGSTAIGTRATLKVTNAVPITVANLQAMLEAYYGGINGMWVMDANAWHEVVALYSNSTNPLLPLEFLYEKGSRIKGILFGFPVYVSDCMNSRDICLGDFSAYVIALKPLREDISEHLYWNSNETAFRSIIRINGCPLWSSGITEQNGAKKYCYVACVAGDAESSSSTSSESSSSSSSSIGYSQSSASSDSSLSNSSQSRSSQSLSSESSQSLSTQSLSSDSSESTQSPSSESTEVQSSSSSSSKSESSESSVEYSSESSESSSSEHVLGCKTKYCASTFTTVAINGQYTWTGATYGGKAVYNNGTYNIWFDTVSGYWACSADVGDPFNQWLSSKDAAGGCPDGAWAGEDGLLAEGSC